jgi:hypothetical protein
VGSGRRAFVFLLVVALAISSSRIGAEDGRAPVTVGQFLVELAQAMGFPSSSEAAAVQSFEGAGLSLPPLDLGQPLTEADVVAVGRALGLDLVTSNPSAPFGAADVSRFLAVFGPELGTRARSDDTGPPAEGEDPGLTHGKGTTNPDPQPDKGKSKGHNKTPSEPI